MAGDSPPLNAPCRCGSGKKYKSCCMESDARRSAASKSRPLIIAGAVILAVIAVFAGSSVFLASQPGPYDDLAKCVSGKGYVMYGASWCDHCAEQKSLFGKSFKYINFVECAAGSGVSQACKDKGIKVMPTWVTPGGGLEPGVKRPSELALDSSCPLENKSP